MVLAGVTSLAAVAATHEAPPPSFSLHSATIVAKWRFPAQSQSSSVILTGQASEQMAITVGMERLRGRNPPTARGFIPAGTFRVDVFPGRLSPGTYLITVSASARGMQLPPRQRTASLKGPDRGLVSGIVVTGRPDGRPVRRFRVGTREVHVRFDLDWLPQPKCSDSRGVRRCVPRRVEVVWTVPGGHTIRTAGKVRRGTVRTFVRSGRPLARGLWHCALYTGGEIVTRVRIPIGNAVR